MNYGIPVMSRGVEHSYVNICRETLLPACGHCGMPVPKTVKEVITCLSRWPIICVKCKKGLAEIRYASAFCS